MSDDQQQPESVIVSEDIEESGETTPEQEETQVFYSFAGGGLAGQNLTLCDRCSALVREDRQEGHTQWHRNGGV
jgi:hypothetical protein